MSEESSKLEVDEGVEYRFMEFNFFVNFNGNYIDIIFDDLPVLSIRSNNVRKLCTLDLFSHVINNSSS